jgi:hypothetical protein
MVRLGILDALPASAFRTPVMARAITLVSNTALHGLARFWLDLTTLMFGGYQPEKHYMRGPGPKWREKHGQRD